MKNSLKFIGENIRIARQSKNLTIEQLAELAGISDSFLGVVERGTSGVSIETLISIAKALDVTTDSLILRKMPPSQSVATRREKLMTLLQNSNDTELDFLIEFVALYRGKAKFEQAD